MPSHRASQDISKLVCMPVYVFLESRGLWGSWKSDPQGAKVV